MYIGAGQKLTSFTEFDARDLFANGELGFWYDLSTNNVTNTNQWFARNLADNSQSLTTSVTSASATLTPNSALAPDNTTTASRVTSTATNCRWGKSLSLTLNATYTVSIYIKRVSGTGPILATWLNVSAYPVQLDVTSSWKRFVFTGQATISASSDRIRLSIPTVGDSIDIWGLQIELAPEVSPYQRIRGSGGGAYSSAPAGSFRMFSELTTLAPVSTSNSSGIVGYLMDSSRINQRGPELVSNGTFNTDLSGWTAGASITAVWNNGQAQITGGGNLTNSARWFYVNSAINYNYRAFEVSFDATWVSGSGNLYVGSGPNNYSSGAAQIISNIDNGPTPQRWTFWLAQPPTAVTTPLCFGADTGTVWLLDNVTCKEIPGAHAYATATTTSPTLRNKSNLVQVGSNAPSAWTLTNLTQTTPQTRMPVETVYSNNVVNINRLQETTAAGEHGAALAATTVIGQPYFWSAYLKADTTTWAALRVQNGTNQTAWINLATGQLGTVQAGVTATIVPVVDAFATGWYRVTLSGNATATNNGIEILLSTGDGVTSYTGATTNGLWAAGVQVIAQNVVPSNKLQVSSGATYATPWGTQHLLFDGVDDFLQTLPLDLTSSQKLDLFVGVQKYNDTAQQMIIEASAAAGTANVGSWYLSGTNAALATCYEVLLNKGATGNDTSVLTSYPGPRNNYAAIQLDASKSAASTSIVPRINEATPTRSDTSTAVTTQFLGNYSLFIGRRNGSTLPFAGVIYFLAGRAATSTTTERTRMEQVMRAAGTLGVV
jgi:hypothetical protein